VCPSFEWQHEIHANVRQEVALALKAIETTRGELKDLHHIYENSRVGRGSFGFVK